MGPRVVPENSIRRDSRDEAESAHHPPRCLQLSNYLERISPICSSRDGGVKLRTCVYPKFHSAEVRKQAHTLIGHKLLAYDGEDTELPADGDLRPPDTFACKFRIVLFHSLSSSCVW